MHAIALVLAASLALGPATTVAPASDPASDVEAPSDADDSEAAAPSEVVAPSEVEAPEPEAEAPEPEAPEPEPEPPAASPDKPAEPKLVVAPPVVHDRLGCDQSKRCRRMTIAGIVVGTLGLGGVGTGIGLLVNKDKVLPNNPVFVTSTRPAGLVMLTVSSGVAFTALLMLVAAHKGYKDRPDDQARLQITPTGLRF